MTTSILIRSIDRLNHTDTPANFRVAMYKIESGVYAITEVYLANMSYSINTKNNSLTFTDTAQHTVTVPVGYYSTAGLATALSSAMTTASGNTYTASVDPNSTLISITGPGAYTLNFGSAPGYYFPTAPFATLATILGYTNDDAIATPPVGGGGWTVTSTYPPNLNSNTAYYITIDTQHSTNSRSIYARRDGGSCTLPVLIDVSSNTSIVYRPRSVVEIELLSTKEFGVRVTDDTGGLVDPLNGQLILVLEKVR